jgi:hypothetical protein
MAGVESATRRGGTNMPAGARLRRVLGHVSPAEAAPAPAGGEPQKKSYDGLPVVENFQEETVEHFRGVELLGDDVMLVTFPKYDPFKVCGSLSSAELLPLIITRKIVC